MATNKNAEDIKFMKKALKLSAKGRGYVHPNPMVGAVIVKNGEIIGEGYHEKFGQAHAEINAIADAGDDAAGSTLYVTLEPCVHHGKTPPCVEAVLQTGIARVVVGMVDPNPQVMGKGINYMRTKGIEVTANVLENECKELNFGYIKFITTGKPFLTLKVAQTLDGRIATSTGHSKWVTSRSSRHAAHQIRARHNAIMIGIGTLLTDDPLLTVRYANGISPIRIILDSKLRVPLDAKLLISDELAPKTIFICTEQASKEKITRIEEKGATVEILPHDEKGWVTWEALLEYLKTLGITSVLIEGGNTVQTSCMRSGHADRIVVFIAPKILGSGIDAIGDLGIRNINSAIQLVNVKIRRIKEDLLFIADFEK